MKSFAMRSAALLALVLAMAGCGGETTETPTTAAGAPVEQATTPTSATSAATAPPVAGDESVSVELVDFSIIVPDLVAVGEIVVRNNGNAPHTFTALDGSFDSGRLEPGGEAVVSVDATGTFEYQCTIHPSQMAGSMVVT